MEQTNQPHRAYSYLMMLGHTCCDTSQSAVPALLPFLIAQRGIDYAAAAGLMFASSFLSSLIQPLLGVIADRKQRPWLMAVGILITGFSIASIGFLESYWGIFTAVLFAGFGSAIFHPEGGRMASCVAGDKKGSSMGTFAAGGNLGVVFGPIVTTLAVSAWGLKGTTVLLIPAIAVSAIFFSLQKKLMQLSNAAQHDMRKNVNLGISKDDWPAFFRLCVSIFPRSIVQNALQTFIPLYWVAVLMQTQQQGSLMVTVMALASAVAAFASGRLADRFGFRRVIRLAFAATSPLIILMLLTQNVWIATAFVLPVAASVQLGHSPSVVLGQTYLPNRVGLASGVTLGLAVSVGGICSPILGKIGDNYGLSIVLYIVAGIALGGALCTLLIRESGLPEKSMAADCSFNENNSAPDLGKSRQSRSE